MLNRSCHFKSSELNRKKQNQCWIFSIISDFLSRGKINVNFPAIFDLQKWKKSILNFSCFSKSVRIEEKLMLNLFLPFLCEKKFASIINFSTLKNIEQFFSQTIQFFYLLKSFYCATKMYFLSFIIQQLITTSTTHKENISSQSRRTYICTTILRKFHTTQINISS